MRHFSKPFCLAVVSLALGALIGAVGAGRLFADTTALPAFEVAEIDVHDADTYKTKYAPLVPATLAPYGGKYLAAGGKVETLEGDAPAKRVVIIQFPSMENAKNWYNSKEFNAIKPIRQAVATTRSFLVEGRAPLP
jgi:uncharacterized protein (DUF1330 family)